MDSSCSPSVLVVGAGVSGLTAATALQEAGTAVAVWETRERVGGRCWSVPVGPEDVCLDLGAAWHWDEHDRVKTLAERLNVDRVRQHEPGIALYEPSQTQSVHRFPWPETPPPSWRIAGGTQALAQRLADALPSDALRFCHRVTTLRQTDAGVAVTADTPDGLHTATADRVIVAVPPRLVAHTIRFDPPLPDDLVAAQRQTPTWMAGSGKAAATFPTAFWRARGIDGRVVSHAGPVAHWHDAVAPDGRAALAGFLHPRGIKIEDESGTAALHDALRLQLEHCFGADAPVPTGIATTVWRNTAATSPPGTPPLSVEHPPSPPPLLTEPHWAGRLLWAGAETAREHPGYLDGAIEAGHRAARCIAPGAGIGKGGPSRP